MKIFHLYYVFEVGGAENMTLALIANEKKYKHTILVFRPKTKFQEYCEKVYGIKFINLNWTGRGILRFSNWTSLIKTLNSLKPDLIHANMYDASLFGRIAGLFLNIPVIISVVNQYHRKKFIRGLANFILAKWTKAIVACSDDVRKDIIKYDFIKNEKIIVIPSFINTDFRNDYSLKIRSKLDFKDSDCLFLFVARLVPQKNIDLLIRAFNILVNTKKIKNIKLIVIGDGPLRIKLLELISLKGLTNYIFLLGEQRNLNPYLTEADFYIDSSKRAGLSLASIKALESGLTPIMSDVGGIYELNQDKPFVLTFESNNVFALVDTILKHGVRRPKKNKEAVKYVHVNFSGKVGANKFVNIYDSILRKK
jgi:glycosyltransferase involved in cell wall biosynthesis